MAKFTLEQLIENLNQKFTTKDGKTFLHLSERTVEETLKPIFSLAGDETELESFTNDIAFPIIDSSNKNYIKDMADFTKNYKPVNSPAPTPKPAPAPQTTDPDIIKRLEAMEKFQKEYKADQAKRESERKRNELTEAVKKMLETQGCSVGLVRENAIYKIGIDTEKSAEDNAKAIKDSYDSILSESIKNGVIPQTSVPLSVKTLTDAEHAKQAKEIGEKLKQFI